MNRLITKNHQLKYDLKQLQAFLEVAHTLSFRKAAENLYISQPAISRKISQLEDALDCELFDRGKSGVRLTQKGEELASQLPDIFRSLFQITESLDDQAAKKNLKIGYTCAAMSSFLPRLISHSTDDLSDYELTFSEKNTTSLIDDVKSKKLDAAFIMARPKVTGIKTTNIRSESLGLMIPENHYLNTFNQIEIRQLKAETLIIFPRQQNPSLYDHIFEVCNEQGVEFNSIREADGCNAIFGFVTAGIGIAFIAESMANLCMRGTQYMPIRKPGLEIKFSLITSELDNSPWREQFEGFINLEYSQPEKLRSVKMAFNN